MTPEEFRSLGHRMVDWIATYMHNVGDLPVASQSRPGDILSRLPEHPPRDGCSGDDWDAIFADIDRILLPGITHWQSPRFFGYFPCNASGPAILGELLSAGLNVNGMLWATSPAATELEIRVLDWMADMLALPEGFRSTSGGGGIIQGTASESTLIALLAARQRTRERGARDDQLVLYTSEHAHSSVIKAAMIAGLTRNPEDRIRLRLIPTDSTFALRPDLLAAAIATDLKAGLIPCCICATVGTTSTTAVDPLPAIVGILKETGARQYGCWLHVDAAHAGAACICPEFRWMLDGVAGADSICFNPHKWLLTNFDCDCFWVQDRASLISALSITPEYLRNRASESGHVVDYRDWQIPLGRRFRALKLWMVIRHYGVRGLQAYIREHVRLAALFESLVEVDPRFELAAPRTVNLVCFRLRGTGEAADARNRKLLDELNESGRLLLTHTVLPSPSGEPRYTLRMAIGAAATEEQHIREAWDQIRRTAERIST